MEFTFARFRELATVLHEPIDPKTVYNVFKQDMDPTFEEFIVEQTHILAAQKAKPYSVEEMNHFKRTELAEQLDVIKLSRVHSELEFRKKHGMYYPDDIITLGTYLILPYDPVAWGELLSHRHWYDSQDTSNYAPWIAMTRTEEEYLSQLLWKRRFPYATVTLEQYSMCRFHTSHVYKQLVAVVEECKRNALIHNA